MAASFWRGDSASDSHKGGKRRSLRICGNVKPRLHILVTLPYTLGTQFPVL